MLRSEFLKGFGKAYQIFKALVDAILARGGDDDDVACLEQMAGQIADMVIAARPAKPEPVPQPAPPLAIPAEGQEFELTLEGEELESQPLEIVRACGYHSTNWRFNGQMVSGKQTARFKLVVVGFCRNIGEVQQKLGPFGDIPEGQWIMAFRKAYPQALGRPVGIAGPSWVSPDGRARFPCVLLDGTLFFLGANGTLDGIWLWLVKCN